MKSLTPTLLFIQDGRLETTREEQSEMSDDSVAAYKGSLLIDVQDIAGELVDLPHAATQHLTREKPEFEGLKAEWAAAMSGPLGPEVIPAALYARFQHQTAVLEKVLARRAEAEKLLEVLKETQAYLEDRREGEIAIVAKMVQATIQHKGEAMGAAFEKTLAYYSQVARKGVETRRKNAEQKAKKDEGE